MINAQIILKNNIEKYNNLFSKNEFYPVQKAYSTPHFIVLGLRFPQKTVALYIGRGNQYQGVFVSDKFPPSFLRVQDRLLDFVRKYLIGTKLGKIKLQQDGKVILFPFKTNTTDNYFLFGYIDRQLVFAKKNEDKIFLSTINKEIIDAEFIKIVQGIEFGKINFDFLESEDLYIEKYLSREESKVSGKPILLKREKFLLRKIGNIKKDLESSKVHFVVTEMLKENKIDLSLPVFSFQDFSVEFKNHSSEWEKKDLLYKKLKKLKKAEILLQERLIDAEKELEKIKKGEIIIESTKEKIIQPLWGKVHRETGGEKMDAKIFAFRVGEFSCVISLDAKSNDWLRVNSSKEHYWFHIENYPGAHLILKTDQISRLKNEDFEVIASVLRDYSKLSMNLIPLMFCQLKHVKGMKGVQGEVVVKKPKYISCPYRSWKEIISTT